MSLHETSAPSPMFSVLEEAVLRLCQDTEERFGVRARCLWGNEESLEALALSFMPVGAMKAMVALLAPGADHIYPSRLALGPYSLECHVDASLPPFTFRVA